MSNGHGGRKIKIVVWEYAYPHSESAKDKMLGAEWKIFETKYQRPSQAFADFIVESMDRHLCNDVFLIKGMADYLFRSRPKLEEEKHEQT